MQDRLRPGDAQGGNSVTRIGQPGLITSTVTVSLIFAFYCALSCLASAAGGPVASLKTKTRNALIQATLLFFGTVDVLNAVRMQDRFGEHHKETKKFTSGPNDRANTVAAFMVFEFLLSLALVAALALNKGGEIKASDSAAKDEAV